MLFDSHMHMNDEQLINRAEEIIQSAKNKGVLGFICVGYTKDSSKVAIELANTYESVYAAIGIHPSEADVYKPEDLKWVEEHINDKKVIALGEIGLDYYWDKTFMEKQKDLFIKQIKIANINKKPIIIHMRDATEDTYEILKNYKEKNLPGVMHCYSGSKEAMKQFIDLNMMISLAGPVTFKNAKKAKEVAEAINLNYLLIETDSPYLSPTPFRGKTNESKNLYYIAKTISEIKNIDFKEFSRITFNNTLRLFSINDFDKEGENQ